MLKKEDNIKKVQIEISIKSLFIVLGFLAGIYVLLSIKNVLFMVFWAFIFTSSLLPAIKKLSKFKYISRGLAVTIVYVSLFLIVTALFTAVTIPLISESIKLFEKLPEILIDLAQSINELGYNIGTKEPLIHAGQLESTLEQLSNNLVNISKELLSAGASGLSGISKIFGQIFGGVINVVSVLVLSIYISLDHNNFMAALLKTIPEKNTRKKIHSYIKSVEARLGKWIVGQLTLSSIVGVLTGLILTILGVPYVLPLAIFAFMMEVVPGVGATTASVPAILIALAGGNIIQIIGVPLGYILVQQIESNFLSPKVMSSALGLPPIIIILAVLIGAHLAGFVGIIMSIPLAALIHLSIEFWSDTKEVENEKPASKKPKSE